MTLDAMSEIPTRITSGGRIVIPAALRRALGLKDGDEVLILSLPTNVVKSPRIDDGGHRMPASTSIRIDQSLYDEAKAEATIEHRTIAGQIEYWAKVGRAALDNPDLPVSFVVEALASLAEPLERAVPFVPRSRRP